MNEPEMSKAQKLKGRGAIAMCNYLERTRKLWKVDRAHTCEHGHLQCAGTEDGPCSDELAHLMEEW